MTKKELQKEAREQADNYMRGIKSFGLTPKGVAEYLKEQIPFWKDELEIGRIKISLLQKELSKINKKTEK